MTTFPWALDPLVSTYHATTRSIDEATSSLTWAFMKQLKRASSASGCPRGNHENTCAQGLRPSGFQYSHLLSPEAVYPTGNKYGIYNPCANESAFDKQVRTKSATP